MAITLALLYPSMLKVTNLDIVRHYENAVRYYESIYPLYYIPISILIVWTEVSAEVTFTALAFLSLLLPLSYYLFVRRVAKDGEMVPAHDRSLLVYRAEGILTGK